MTNSGCTSTRNSVNVLISFDLPAELVEMIKDVSPRIRVQEATDDKELLTFSEDAHIFFVGKFSHEMFVVARNLRWIQTHLVGVDRFLFPDLVKSDLIMTNARGVNSTAVAEHVFGLMLCLSRQLHIFARKQAKKQWKTNDADLLPRLGELSGKTLGVIGLGTIGREIAKRANCFEMRVVGTRRSRNAPKPEYIDSLVAPQNTKELFENSDFVVIQLPLTNDTEGFVGEDELRSMKNTAFLINASRGKVIQENILIRALEESWIAGAGLDTFASEPLPINSPLWTMDNVIITPHVAGLTPRYMERLVKLFCENLKHFLNNEKMINVVDKTLGY